MSQSKRIAVVGAGISGLTCAIRLQEAGASVQIFEKSRGLGGRLSTRRCAGMSFDHGAQFFTARTEAFQSTVQHWVDAGAVAPWNARFGYYDGTAFRLEAGTESRWVGTPGMSAIGRHLGQELQVALETRVTALRRRGSGWLLDVLGTEDSEPFDAVLLSCPGFQVAAMTARAQRVQALAQTLRYDPCWAVMLGFEQPLDVPLDAFRIENSALSWAAREGSKPGRPEGERWVLHASPAWSQEHLEDPAEIVGKALCDAFSAITACNPNKVLVHRWRYARTTAGDHPPAYFDEETGVGLCGDGLTGPRVEEAWRSGVVLAKLVQGKWH